MNSQSINATARQSSQSVEPSKKLTIFNTQQKENIHNNAQFLTSLKLQNKGFSNKEKLEKDIELLKEKLNSIELILKQQNKFRNSVNLIDLQDFSTNSYSIFSQLISELLEHKQLNLIEIKKGNTLKQGKELQTPNCDNYDLQIKQLQQSISDHIIERYFQEKQLRETQDKYKQWMQKKDFFSEYEEACKQVDALRKQNQILVQQQSNQKK